MMSSEENIAMIISRHPSGYEVRFPLRSSNVFAGCKSAAISRPWGAISTNEPLPGDPCVRATMWRWDYASGRGTSGGAAGCRPLMARNCSAEGMRRAKRMTGFSLLWRVPPAYERRRP